MKDCMVCLQGKFIRIHFGPNGKIAGADIETCKGAIDEQTGAAGYFFKNVVLHQ